MMRVILWMHRYLGVALGLLMTLWCLSGFVMMYRGYPHLAEAARLRGLEPLRWAACCDARRLGLDDGARLSRFSVEMLAGRPVLRLAASGPPRTLDLATGAELHGLAAPTVQAAAVAYARGNGIAGAPHDLGLIDKDQWTVEGASRRGPVHHLRFDDPAGAELYIADRTGEAVQATTRTTRFWAWLGAIPHWLYPTVLRQNAVLWDAVVVWTSLIGCFLTVTGLYVGIARFRRYGGGRWSPYRGWFYWHHISGLIFGVLTLTWVASGLMTMNPWGFLDTPVGSDQRQRLAGGIPAAEAKRFIAAAPAMAPADVVRLEAAPLGGHLFVMATRSDGASARLDADGRPAPLTALTVVGAVLATHGPAVTDVIRLDHEDDYYYSGYDGPAPLPVYRASLRDGQATTLYIDARSGQVVQALDQTARASRWLRTGLHDWDFAGLRRRPVWDVVVLILLAGVTAVCALGAWLGLQRLQRDLAGLFRRREGRS